MLTARGEDDCLSEVLAGIPNQAEQVAFFFDFLGFAQIEFHSEILNLGEKDVLPGEAHKENLLDRVSWVSRLGIAEAERPVMEEILAQSETLAAQVHDLAGAEEPIRSVAPAAGKTRPGAEAIRSPLAETGQLLKSAPAVKGNYFKVANIIE